MFSFPYQEVVEINKFLALIYLTPLLRVPQLIRGIRTLVCGEKFDFNRQSNELLKNSRKLSSLTDIAVIEINYKIDSDFEQKFLETRLLDNQQLRLFDFRSEKELISCGRQIAKFLQVELWNNYPHGKELLWGRHNVSDGDIKQANEHLKNAENKR